MSLLTLFSKTKIYYNGPVSDHFDGTRFFNPGFDTDAPPGAIRRWQKERTPAVWPKHVPLGTYTKPPARVEGNALRVTFLGHATFLIQTQGLNIITDPLFSKRASPFSFIGPRRVSPPGVAFDDLPKIDVMLVSHNHYDHMDLAAIRRIRHRDNPKIVTPLGNDYFVKGAATLDWGQSTALTNDVSLSLEQAYHWSARGLYDRRKALWGAFIIGTPAGNIYFGGDTAYRDGAIFKAARVKYGSFRMAMLPIGAYAPRWFMKTNHMDPAEAVQVYRDLGEPISLAMHFKTVQLTDEAIDAPAHDLAQVLAAQGIAPDRFRAPEIGQGYDIP